MLRTTKTATEFLQRGGLSFTHPSAASEGRRWCKQKSRSVPSVTSTLRTLAGRPSWKHRKRGKVTATCRRSRETHRSLSMESGSRGERPQGAHRWGANRFEPRNNFRNPDSRTRTAIIRGTPQVACSQAVHRLLGSRDDECDLRAVLPLNYRFCAALGNS